MKPKYFNMDERLKSLLSLLIVGLYSLSLHAQQGKIAPRTAVPFYQLKGPVKSYTMISEEGIIRRQVFDLKGKPLLDTKARNNPPQSDYKAHTPELRKAYFEQSYAASDSIPYSTFKLNERGQIVEKKYLYRFPMAPDPPVHMNSYNYFDEAGKIILSWRKGTTGSVRTHDSQGPITPHVALDEVAALSHFSYNEAGFLIEYEYYYTYKHDNMRVVYKRDSANQIIEILRYGESQIGNTHHQYMDFLLRNLHPYNFNIERHFSDFWSNGYYKPSKEVLQYDSLGNLSTYYWHYVNFDGGDPRPTHKVSWTYDEAGKRIEERRYQLIGYTLEKGNGGFNIYPNYKYFEEIKLEAILKFDASGNVIEETVYEDGEEQVYRYEIEYY